MTSTEDPFGGPAADFLFEDVFEKVGVSVSQTLSAKVRALKQLESDILEVETKLQDLKQAHERMVTADIPGLMAEMGVQSITVDGARIEVDNVISARITEAKRDEAMEWLRQNGHEDLIKNEVSVALGKGGDALAARLVETIRQLGLDPTQKQAVHPSTLKSFVKKALENGMNLDYDLLGVFVRPTARITRK